MAFSESLKKDLFRYSGRNTFWNYIKIILINPGARFIFLFRMCGKFKKQSILGVFFRFWINLLTDRKNVEIPIPTQINKGCYFGHFRNIIINQNAIIGENCNIMHGVTIGNISRGKRKGSPIIGNRVVVGPNSVIVGKIIIGDDVLIAPLTLVNFDIPSGSVVGGNPGKIISNIGSTGYINKIFAE